VVGEAVMEGLREGEEVGGEGGVDLEVKGVLGLEAVGGTRGSGRGQAVDVAVDRTGAFLGDLVGYCVERPVSLLDHTIRGNLTGKVLKLSSLNQPIPLPIDIGLYLRPPTLLQQSGIRRQHHPLRLHHINLHHLLIPAIHHNIRDLNHRLTDLNRHDIDPMVELAVAAADYLRDAEDGVGAGALLQGDGLFVEGVQD
jgi:hypothetical protein